MKKTITVTVIIFVITLIALVLFDKFTSKRRKESQFTEVSSGK